MSVHSQESKNSLHQGFRFAGIWLLLLAGNGYVIEYYLTQFTPAMNSALRSWLDKWIAYANTLMGFAAFLFLIHLTLSLYDDRKRKRHLELGHLDEDEV